MNSHRLRYYFAQIGCDDRRLGAGRSPNQHCDETLGVLGFSPDQIAQVERSSRSHPVRRTGRSAFFLTVSAVAAAWNVHRFDQLNQGISLLVDNWDNLELAYSVADAIGWDTTAHLAIVTAKGSVPIGTFLFEHSGELQSLAETLGVGAEVASLKADLADALVTGGVSLGLSFAAWGFVKWMNSKPQERLEEVEARTAPVRTLHVMLASGALPRAIRKQLALVPQTVADA